MSIAATTAATMATGTTAALAIAAPTATYTSTSASTALCDWSATAARSRTTADIVTGTKGRLMIHRSLALRYGRKPLGTAHIGVCIVKSLVEIKFSADRDTSRLRGEARLTLRTRPYPVRRRCLSSSRPKCGVMMTLAIVRFGIAR